IGILPSLSLNVSTQGLGPHGTFHVQSKPPPRPRPSRVGWLGAELSLVATLRFNSRSHLFTIHTATPAVLGSLAVVGESAVSTASRRGTDNSGISRSSTHAALSG